MKFVNGWRWMFKDGNRFDLTLRLGVVTVFCLLIDISDRYYALTVMNFRVEIGG